MGSRFYHWWFRRATYPRTGLHVLMAAVYLVLAIESNDEALTWLGIVGTVLFIARAAGDFSYRRRHQPPPKQHWYDALG